MTTLALLGSGEFTSAMENFDRHLFTLTGKKNPYVITLPTAAGQEHDAQKWVIAGTKHLNSLGANAIGLPVYNRREAENPEFTEQVKAADIIYLSGGDPGYLKDCLTGTALWSAIKTAFRQRVILAGSSAGAMVMGPYVLANAQRLENEAPSWEKAFGLIQYAVMPHYDLFRTDYAKELKTSVEVMPPVAKKQWLGIDEDTAMVLRGSQAEVFGKGKVYRYHPDEQVFSPGDRFKLA